MKNLSDHLVDILENSVSAGSSEVEVTLGYRRAGRFFWVIEDNGPGLPDGDPTDPFVTTRRERSIGLGLALLRETAERSGGSLELGNAPGGGARLVFETDLGAVDARPLGDLARAMVDAAVFWPGIRLRFYLAESGGREIILDTGDSRRNPGNDARGGRAARETLTAGLRRRLDKAGIDTQFGRT